MHNRNTIWILIDIAAHDPGYFFLNGTPFLTSIQAALLNSLHHLGSVPTHTKYYASDTHDQPWQVPSIV
jgi:hypothetical protein